MARLIDADSTLKRLRNRYRLVVMNDDTYEEVVTFKLSRMSVYNVLSTIFVLLVGLTVALITFTNLKYYLPGYGSQSQRKELVMYKTKIDSLERASIQKDVYLENLKKVLSGDAKTITDTATLKIPDVEKITQ